MTDPAQLADLAINQPDVALIFEAAACATATRRPWWWNCSRAT